MTLNATLAGARPASRKKLEGPERGLDAAVGLVILIAGLLIGFVTIMTLVEIGSANPTVAANIGYDVALVGGGFFFLITTIIYLVRIAIGRRSWTAPLWGTILMSVCLIIGYIIMASGS